MEPVVQDWPFQEALDLLLKSGFIEKDDEATQRWKTCVWAQGKTFYTPCYRWTPTGKHMCFRFAYTTPMSWAEEISVNHMRHCILCGRDCAGKKVYARKGIRCVCYPCAAKAQQNIEELL